MNRRAGWQTVRTHWRGLPLRLRRGLQLVAGVAVLVLLLAVLFRDPIGRWLWPDPRYDALRQRGEVALQAGKLSASDGSGARELFEAALALQPDQLEARDGLARVAAAALARAEVRLRAGDIPQAQAALQLARALQAPQQRIDTVEARLRAVQTQPQATGVEALLVQAHAALQAGHLDAGPTSALPLFQQALQVQPRNPRALEGREDALELLLQPAPAALARGDLAQAVQLLRRAEVFDAGFSALPALHAGVAQALDAQDRAIRQHLARGRLDATVQACAHLAALALVPPSGVCGAALGDALLQAAEAAAAGHHAKAARHWLAAASATGVAADRVQQVAARLQRAEHTATDAATAAPPRVLQGKQSVPRLLKAAARAQARGHWLTPPGGSAWDALRQAHAVAPQDPRVLAATQAMRVAAQQCHVTALRDNNLGRARECLDAWRQLAPDAAGLLAARRTLATRWLAVGDERLRGGNVRGAQEALERARQVDASVPGIDALAQRLQRIQPKL